MNTPANGRAAVIVLTYLGFALQMVQVGLLPLLPAIGRQLHATAAGTSWILTSGLLSGAVFLAVLTRLADLIGKKPVILLAMALVLAGCVITSFANTLPLVLVGRVLIGAQLPMLALPEAIASDTLPPARAHTAISAIHVGTGLGIAGGLLLGAVIGIHPANWHLFFVACAIAALIGLVATTVFVRDSPARAGGGLDVPGAVLLTLSLVTLLLGLSQGPSWGWSSAPVLGLLIGGLALGALWWWRERTADTPLIDVSYLLRPEVGLPYLMTFLIAFGIYGSLSAVTRLAQTPVASGFGYGWSSLTAGWFALPQAVGSVLGIVVLRTARPRGLVLTSAIGFTSITLGFLAFALGHAIPVVELIALGFDSMGLAVALAATQLLVLRAVPAAESGIALGLSVVMYAVGNSVGSAVAGVFFASLTTPAGQPALSSYLVGFAVCGLCSLAALAACIPLARRRSAVTHLEGATA
ncbi:MFS transporter [Amycolatopsis sp.]|uniref:MFS transporter n=1 Tax=Amycolatopsis sp. TaxID=37632 RepID=UPI002CB95D53|nr:MFS transporter [Amycolatopsis sp.]HVV09803.1 MFS transporter [Amycolatopsis sp.]